MVNKILCGMIVLLVAFTLTVSAPPSFAGDKSYINGIDANFPPFAYVNKNGEPDGFDVKALDWIAKEMGFSVVHKPMDWDGIIPSLKAKKIDMIASGMSATAERAKQVNFTVPYWQISQVLVIAKDSKLSVEEVLGGGNKIGVQRGTTEAKWMKENLVKKGVDIKLMEYDSAPLSVEDVGNGRIVAAAMDDAPAKDAERKRPVKILGTFGMQSENFAYAVRKEDTELLKTLNEGLNRLMASPYWEELKRTYKP